jgi:hypothetical protein
MAAETLVETLTELAAKARCVFRGKSITHSG